MAAGPGRDEFTQFAATFRAGITRIGGGQGHQRTGGRIFEKEEGRAGKAHARTFERQGLGRSQRQRIGCKRGRFGRGEQRQIAGRGHGRHGDDRQQQGSAFAKAHRRRLGRAGGNSGGGGRLPCTEASKRLPRCCGERRKRCQIGARPADRGHLQSAQLAARLAAHRLGRILQPWQIALCGRRHGRGLRCGLGGWLGRFEDARAGHDGRCA
ncbi:MAG: hypothetical protein ACJLS3_10655 [Erythrobacter sp.]